MADLPTRNDFQDYAAWPGREVHASDGGPLGLVDAIFLDEATDAPEWVLVRLNDDGGVAFVPLAGATVQASAIRVDQDRDRIGAAPRPDAGQTLSIAEERRLYEHYRVPYSESESPTVLPEGEGAEPEAPRPARTPAPASARPRLRRFVDTPEPAPVKPPAPAEAAPSASSASRLPHLALPALLGAAIAGLIGLLALRRRRSS
ncbi:MAG TPA: hypothetical protein VES79_08475 [Solirubrobacteraceae bacterium]|nr:hypothetical protein [Solirubrobacteraceae bacterium]